MKLNVWKIGFLTGLILSLGNVDKAVTFPSKSVDNLPQSQDIATLAKLTPAQVEKLIDLEKKKIRVRLGNGEFEDREFRVIVPTYITPGFKVDKLEVKDNNSYKSYNLYYKNFHNLCFYIGVFISLPNMLHDQPSGGSASILIGTFTEVNLPLIGKAYLSIAEYNRVSTNSSISLVSLQKDLGFKFESPCNKNDNNITPKEAVKIVESLQYLNP